MNCDVAALRAEVKANHLQLRQNYECSNDARALLRERCAQVDAVLQKLWDAFGFPASLALAAVGGIPAGRGAAVAASVAEPRPPAPRRRPRSRPVAAASAISTTIFRFKLAF